MFFSWATADQKIALLGYYNLLVHLSASSVAFEASFLSNALAVILFVGDLVHPNLAVSIRTGTMFGPWQSQNRWSSLLVFYGCSIVFAFSP